MTITTIISDLSSIQYAVVKDELENQLIKSLKRPYFESMCLSDAQYIITQILSKSPHITFETIVECSCCGGSGMLNIQISVDTHTEAYCHVCQGVGEITYINGVVE